MLLVFSGLNAVISLVGGIQVEDLGTRVQLGYTNSTVFDCIECSICDARCKTHLSTPSNGYFGTNPACFYV
jgi:hypothetical protein